MVLNRRLTGIVCLLMTGGLLFFGLWPFETSPKNRAYWLANAEGLRFDGENRRLKLSVGGIAYTPSRLSSLKPPSSKKNSFTVEIVLRPAVEVRNGIPHILGFIDGSGNEAFYLGQWKQSLIVRWFTLDQSGRKWRKEIGVRDALLKDKTRRLTLVADRTNCTIYVNGELVKSFQDVALIGEKESLRGYWVALGNSMSVKAPWTGAILALKVYERALSENEIAEELGGPEGRASDSGLIASYAFDKSQSTSVPDLSGNRNELEVPERVTLRNRVLGWPDWRNQKDSSPVPDIAVNILGFVPFGLLFAFWRGQVNGPRRRSALILTVLVGALISLVIEVTQAFIPARDSNMVDVICNTAGAAIGAGIMMAIKLGGWEARKP